MRAMTPGVKSWVCKVRAAALMTTFGAELVR